MFNTGSVLCAAEPSSRMSLLPSDTYLPREGAISVCHDANRNGTVYKEDNILSGGQKMQIKF